MIFGGFSFDRKGTSFGCIIEIRSSEKLINSEDDEKSEYSVVEIEDIH